MADAVRVGKKTEKRDSPQHRPEQKAFVELWESQLHLNEAFLEPCEDTGVLIRTAADDFLFRVTAEIAVREIFSNVTPDFVIFLNVFKFACYFYIIIV